MKNGWERAGGYVVYPKGIAPPFGDHLICQECAFGYAEYCSSTDSIVKHITDKFNVEVCESYIAGLAPQEMAEMGYMEGEYKAEEAECLYQYVYCENKPDVTHLSFIKNDEDEDENWEFWGTFGKIEEEKKEKKEEEKKEKKEEKLLVKKGHGLVTEKETEFIIEWA